MFWKIIILIMAVLALLGVLWINERPVSVIETPESEVKVLPAEVIEKIGQAQYDKSFQVPILLYHYVEYVKDTNDTIRQSLNITPDIFEEQVKTLSEAGYTFLTMRELGLIIDDKQALPEKPVVLTFDDGHWDIYTDVWPILKKHQAKITVFMITDFINGSDFLSTEQIREIVGSKEIEIGAHTVHHVSLAYESAQTLKFQVEQSKKTLEKDFGLEVVSFAYPNGALDLAAMQAVEDAGYWTAVSTVLGTNVNKGNRFALYRLRPGRLIGENLLERLREVN
ncbi:hypothetical protein A2262_03810 [Candidatus Roizmanbacteria bacterium RIFOXYA2_FULL_41_8]|nr:MAG: hypothetical protein A2262_03810 [Candidatus Roizmanbacteria bacterium RIFOXYA2_FULL_41_8]OGK66963.1 MAG: hypothetical protein A2377_03775 [Candidatus Roizmanbacteria bacterium RIFOXYB1_FULL_41_27]OGK74880.1 MAG: hypothetical protein A2459_04795 [Candidatus Roizmanbacteria bacterium RIFOXYC2_FULL_41_10]